MESEEVLQEVNRLKGGPRSKFTVPESELPMFGY
jgi:hypothetical protein